jgi:hypothetical protein
VRWAVVVGILVAGCYSPTPQEGAPCAMNGACPDGLRCIDARCVSGAPPDGSTDAAIDTADAPADAFATGVQFVQAAYADSQTTVSSLTVAMPQPQTAGAINVVFISWFSSDGLASITDTQGVLYQQRINPPGGTVRMSAYTSGPLVFGANSVTVTFTGPTDFPEIRVVEYRGVSATNPVGSTRRSQNMSGTCSVTIDTAGAGEVVVVANAAENTSTTTLSTGFTERLRTAFGQHVVGDARPVMPGQLTASAGLTGTTAWIMEAITLRP